MTPEEAYYKCWGNRKRDKDLEPFIIKDPEYAYFYAKDIIKGRWLEAEPFIIQDSGWAFYYAADIIKGKLPENMHNAMLAYADTWAKKYFNYIKNKTQP
jgi:hypothetical protein